MNDVELAQIIFQMFLFNLRLGRLYLKFHLKLQLMIADAQVKNFMGVSLKLKSSKGESERKPPVLEPKNEKKLGSALKNDSTSENPLKGHLSYFDFLKSVKEQKKLGLPLSEMKQNSPSQKQSKQSTNVFSQVEKVTTGIESGLPDKQNSNKSIRSILRKASSEKQVKNRKRISFSHSVQVHVVENMKEENKRAVPLKRKRSEDEEVCRIF